MLTFKTSENGEIGHITLDKPPVNAWTAEDYHTLVELIRHINESELISVVTITAQGRMFSAGADIKRLARDDARATAARRPLLRRAIEALATCEVPVIVGIHGHAIGVGAVVASLGDIVIAQKDTLISIPEINVGVVGAADAMRRFMPENLVRYLALTGDSVTAQRLYDLGAIQSLVADETKLLTEVHRLSEVIAHKGYLASRKWKEALDRTDPRKSINGFMIEQTLSQELSVLSRSTETNE